MFNSFTRRLAGHYIRKRPEVETCIYKPWKQTIIAGNVTIIADRLFTSQHNGVVTLFGLIDDMDIWYTKVLLDLHQLAVTGGASCRAC